MMPTFRRDGRRFGTGQITGACVKPGEGIYMLGSFSYLGFHVPDMK